MEYILFVFLAALLLLVSETGLAEAVSPDSDYSEVKPFEELVFYQNRKDISIANGWGDPAVGPHGNFIKLVGKSESGRRTHSFDYYRVVVTGTIANERSDNTRLRSLRPGSFWIQKGNEPHVTDCVSKTECLIFVIS